MKIISKHGIAALFALTALGAHAQSSVTLFGLLDLSIGSTKAPGGDSQTAIDNGKFTTSHFGMRGSEDLGGGLSAVFKLEAFLRADTGESGRFTGDTLFSRNASVGLSSKDFGTFMLGRNTTPLFVSTLSFNAFGDSYGFSPSIRHYFTSGTVTGDSGWSNSVIYSSPSFSGFKFGLAAATKGGGNGQSNGGNWGADVGYASGPLAAALVFQDVKKDGATPVPDTRTWQLNGAYDFGVAKTFLQYGQVKNFTVPNTFRISGIGAKVPVGAGALLAQWGRVSPKTGPDRNTLSLGYDHNLSKRTDLYAAVMRDKIDGLSSGQSYSLGIRHRF
ncbi:MAG: porin [Polaromonas sp.]